jgi:hypothetical protein
MTVYCPSCGATIFPEHMNLQNLVATCWKCERLVPLREYLRYSQWPFTLYNDGRRLTLPPGFEVDDSGQGLEITRRWFHPFMLFGALFCIVWHFFLLLWLVTALDLADFSGPLKPTFFVSLSVVATYYTLSGLFNRTTIAIEQGELTLKIGPVWWPGGFGLPANSVEEIRCRQDVLSSDSDERDLYCVLAVSKTGNEYVLADGLARPEYAVFLERLIAGRLGLRHSGETSKGGMR